MTSLTRRLTPLALLLALGLLFPLGCASSDSAPGEGSSSRPVAASGDQAEAGCACPKGKAGEAVWCGDCNVGYVNSQKMKCEGCFTANTGGAACEGCSTDGCSCSKGKAGETVWCPHCKVGYKDGKKLACKGCFTAAAGGGDCEGCGKE